METKAIKSSFINIKKDSTKVKSGGSTYMGSATAYYFILPAITILALMVFYPLLYGFYLSITDMSLKTFKHPNIIGLKNYFDVLKNPRIFRTLLRTIVWTFVNVGAHVALGLTLAVILNRKLPGKKFLRIFLIIPWAMPQYISALTWKGMFNLKFGAVNIFLQKFGLDPVPWLSEPTMTFIAAIITNIWLGFPFMMMVALGALQSIPADLYEAAEIDGASSWQQFKNITLPMLKPAMTPSIVLGTVWTFNMLNVILIIAGGFGNDKTQILVTEVYRMSFQFYRYGYAAAYSVLIFIILLVFGINYVKKSKVLGED